MTLITKQQKFKVHFVQTPGLDGTEIGNYFSLDFQSFRTGSAHRLVKGGLFIDKLSVSLTF